ncbi:hypothetical protein OUZ56_018226 [Daphnia magna]|uniref:Regulatory protein zeste n=1 Tax=Daphnia magna TaxID=35525 RepID=A0ABQ9Z8E2_9CRUS|nr:hypothetical protein OUZ56_018226 [Daphnia magna]
MVTAQTAETGVAFIHDSSSFLNWNCLKLSAILEVVGDILNGAYSSTVTKERKNSLWKEITSVIHNDHPECGGPLGEDGILRPIYQKYYEEVLGLDNPAVSATAIPGAIDTDDLTVVAKNAVLQQQIVLAITGRSDQPTEEVISNETLMESSENNQLVATHYSEEQYYVMDQSGS